MGGRIGDSVPAAKEADARKQNEDQKNNSAGTLASQEPEEEAA
jgi:hypothetical protein